MKEPTRFHIEFEITPDEASILARGDITDRLTNATKLEMYRIFYEQLKAILETPQ